ncbi:MAG: efflux RND transporter periplasmic adaptor subunit [Puniceicoccales bacterium]|jgi:RND family efflux transporter MFP subunit|nr:efflux RND transporter periplasmic adaptor subunit [Puniceicoccales bacterium]
MKIKTIFQLIVFLALVVGAYFLVRELAIPEVDTLPVRRGSITRSATGNVTVLPVIEASLTAPEKGILLRFGTDDEHAYVEGDVVKKGDIIAELDPGNLPFLVNQIEAELESVAEKLQRGSPAQANLEQLKKDLQDEQKLLPDGFSRQYAVRDLETRIARLEAEIKLDEINLRFHERRLGHQLDQYEDQLDRLTLRAPFDGVIMSPLHGTGDLLFAGNQITKITSTAKLIKVEVNQDDLNAVRESKRVIVNFFSFPEAAYEGKLNYLVPIGNSSNQRFTVFLKMNALPDGLLSGQTGEATFIADEHHNTLLIPLSALMGDSVFVAKDGRTEKRKVQLGFTSVATAEVLSGLDEGELVVTKDVDLQRDHARIKVKSTVRR